MRPAEVDQLVGDSSKARDSLGWAPTLSFEELVQQDGGRRSARVRDELAGALAGGAA